MQPRYEWEKICYYCKKSFKNIKGLSRNKFHAKRFCGQECYHNARNEINSKITIPFKNCEHCNNIFYKKVNCSRSDWEYRRRFCSKECADNSQIGVKIAEEIRARMRGERLKTNELIDYGSVRLRILKRDKYICQRCGFTDKDIMEVDHIKPRQYFPELTMAPDNLMTLCPNCHRRKTLEDNKIDFNN